MIVEVVKSEGLGKERVDRHVDVRSVDLPSTRGMVRLDDVVELLLEDDDVPRHAIERLKENIDEDPSTGGHIAIHSPSTSAHTALFERVEIYTEDVHEARGSSVCGPEETWLKVVIPKDLDERIYDAIHHDPAADFYNRSTLVEQAVEEFLDESTGRPTAEDLKEADEGELVREMERRGYDVPAREITADGGDA
jgi:hypothetical protein